MKKSFAILLVSLLLIPNVGTTQVIDWERLSVSLGGEYSMITSDSRESSQNLHKFKLTPYLQLSYNIEISKLIDANVYIGHSQLGGINYYTKNQIKYRRELGLNTITAGIKGLIDLEYAKIGPLIGINRIYKSKLLISKKEDSRWEKQIEDDDYGRFLRSFSTDVGITIQHNISSHFNISIEGIFGIGDIFVNEDLLGANPMTVRWLSRHHRINIGYSF